MILPPYVHVHAYRVLKLILIGPCGCAGGRCRSSCRDHQQTPRRRWGCSYIHNCSLSPTWLLVHYYGIYGSYPSIYAAAQCTMPCRRYPVSRTCTAPSARVRAGSSTRSNTGFMDTHSRTYMRMCIIVLVHSSSRCILNPGEVEKMSCRQTTVCFTPMHYALCTMHYAT